MSRYNAAVRGDIQRAVSDGHKALVRITANVTGARSAPVREAAGVLARAWRQVLGTPGGNLRTSLETRRVRGAPSAPGQPPHRITGKAQRSIASAVVDGVRRVGTGLFKLRLLEGGVSATATKGRRVSAKGARKGRKAVATRAAAYRLTIAPRPSAARALELAAPRMTDVLVSEIQRSLA